MVVIGQKTAELCEALKINVDFIPNDYSQEGFLNQFKRINKAFSYRVVFEARPKLQHTLAQNNIVTKIDLYKPIPNDRNIREVIQLIEHHKVHALTFSSSSAVNAYIKHDVPCGFDKYVAIGAQTANTLRKNGLKPLIVINKLRNHL